MFLPAIKNQQTEPPMTDRLVTLTKRVAELRQAGLEACHCIEEFFIRWIRPLGRWKTLAFAVNGRSSLRTFGWLSLYSFSTL
jgi:hypothetical protein